MKAKSSFGLIFLFSLFSIVQINAQDQASFDVMVNDYCDSALLQFTNTSSFTQYTGPVTYVWDIGGKTFTGFVHPDTIIYLGYHNISLTAYDDLNNVIGEFFDYVDLQPCGGGDFVDFELFPNGECAPLIVSFNNMSNFKDYAGPVTYEWWIDGTMVSGDFNLVDQSFDIGNHEVVLYAYDDMTNLLGEDHEWVEAFDCSGDYITFDFYIENGGCAPANVQLYNNSVLNNHTGYVAWEWNINGNMVYEQHPAPWYFDMPGYYEIKLTALDTFNNLIGEKIKYVDIMDCGTGGGDFVSFEMFPNGECAPLNVSFSNMSNFKDYAGPVTYEWWIDGTMVSGDFNLVDQSFDIGNHEVVLYAYDDMSNLLGEDYKWVEAFDCSGDYVTFDFYIENGCAPTNVQLYNNSVLNNHTGYVAWEWNINGNMVYEQHPAPWYFEFPGNYEIRLTALDTFNNIIGERTKWVDIMDCGGGNFVDFEYYTEGGCAPVNVSFMNKSSFPYYSGEVRYFWYLNEHQWEGFQLPDTMLYGGNYNVRLTAVDTLGNWLGDNWRDIWIEGSPGYFRTVPKDGVCPGEPVRFNYDGPYSYIRWDLGDGNMREYDNWFEHTYMNEDEYTVTLIVDDMCGRDTITQVVSVNQNAVPFFDIYTTSGDHFCPYDEIQFQTDGNFSFYTWQFNGDVIQTDKPFVKYAFSTMGEHQVILTATNACGNSNSDTMMVYIDNNMSVYADFHWWFEGSDCPNTPVIFEAHSSGTYQWNFGDGGTSTLMRPSHVYADTGKYTVRLIVTNGCGATDTAYQDVWVNYTYETVYVDWDFERKYYDGEYSDTLRVCPGEEVQFRNWTCCDLKYTWDFGDNMFSNLKEPTHVYTQPGLKAVTLYAENACMGSGMLTKWVMVDPMIMPMTDVFAIPHEICPGEEVGFYDMENDPEYTGYIYDFVFGDGAPPVTGVDKVIDQKTRALASHSYTDVGVYDYQIMVTNYCNNSDTIRGKIVVSTDATKVPFYYASNSTINDEKGQKEMEDWSQPSGTDDHEFIIPVQWSAWTPDLDSSVVLYFWYGEFDPDKNEDEPYAFVKFKPDDMITGDSVKAYVPVKITEFHSIGMAATWYCDPEKYMGQNPPVFGMPVDMQMKPVTAFPISSGGYTDLRYINPMGIVLDPNNEWDGMCEGIDPRGRWKEKTMESMAYFLDLWEDDMEMGRYNISQGSSSDGGDGSNSMYISDGDYWIDGDTIAFMSMWDPCTSTGTYTIVWYQDSLKLVPQYDTCTARYDALANRTFMRFDYEGEWDASGCPGDNVEFMVVGGDSFVWHFGDGTTGTNRYEYHAYADTGFYDAYVVITNACGRTDTLPTPVEIRMNNTPDAWFDINNWEPLVGDTIWFDYHGYDPGMNNTFLWEFGDGKTSTLPNPRHVYTISGDYEVKLTVANGCGEQTNYQHLWVRKKFDNCDIEARFTFDPAGDNTLQFNDKSIGNITQWYWDFGDGGFSTEENPSHTFVPGVYTVCLSVKDSISGCNDVLCVHDIVVGTLDCIADYVFATVNSTNTVSFTNKSMGGTKWNWDFGDGKFSIEKDPVHQYDYPGYYWVCLSIFDENNGCQANKCLEIQVGQIDSTLCRPEFSFFIDSMKVNFMDESMGNITDYYWDFGDGNVSFDPYTEHVYAKTGNYQVCLSVFDSISGCQQMVCKELRIGVIDCEARFTHVMNPDDNSVNFSDKSVGKVSEWTWDFGDGTYSKLQNPLHQYTEPGIYRVCLSTYDPTSDCFSDVCKEIKVGYVDTTNFCFPEFSWFIEKVTNSDGSITNVVYFTDESQGAVTSWYWDFSDGSIANTQSPKHAFTKDGLYTVCLSILDETSGCQGTVCKDIKIGAVGCQAEFSQIVDPDTRTVSFKDKSTGSVSEWYWDFGDGSFSVEQNPVYTYPKAGIYKVCLYTSDEATGCYSEKCKEITVGVLDTAFCFADYEFFKEDLTVRFVNKSEGNNLKYRWNFGDGQFGVLANPSHTYSKPGVYKVCLNIFNDITGCQDALCLDIKVGIVDCNAEFTKIIDPATNTVEFIDNSVGAVSKWLWDFGDGNLSVMQNPKYTYASPGIYDVCLTTRDEVTGCVSTICKQIQVGSILPQDCFAEFSFFTDSMTVYFTNESTGNYTEGFWDFGDGYFSHNEKPVHTYEKPGVYEVCGFIWDSISGCQSEVCKLVEVGAIDCNAEFAYFLDVETKTVDFVDKSTGAVSEWFWDFGDGNFSVAQNASYTFPASGTYKVCLSTNDESTGCFSEKCKEIQVTLPDEVICNAKYTHIIDEGTRNVKFKDGTVGGVSEWYWDFGDGNFSKVQSPSHTYSEDGIYTVCLSTFNDSTNCRSERCKDISISTATGVQVLDAEFAFFIDPATNEVEFADKSTGNVTNWYWTFGDGGYFKGESKVTHNYGSSGTYQVCLYVFDASTGAASEVCKAINVGERECKIAADFGKFIDPDTRTVNFSDKSQGMPAKWFWTFGDGTTSSKQNPVHIYEKAGFYLVSLSVRDESGNCTDYYADFIQVGSVDCKANFSFTVDVDNNSVQFTDESRGSVAKYFWTFDDGNFSTLANPQHTYSKPGLYLVTLAISTEGGLCRDFYVEPVQVGTVDCNADFTAYVDSLTNIAYFKNEALGSSTNLLWLFGDGGISTMENPRHAYAAPGYYTVGLNTYNFSNNCMDYHEETILIGQEGIDCEADFFYQVDNDTRDVQFFDKSLGDELTYFWWFGDGNMSTDPNPVNTYVNGGFYNVCLTVYTASGVQNTTCKFVAVAPPARENCLADFIYTVDSTNLEVTFTDKSLGSPDKWRWDMGDGNILTDQNPVYTFDEAGFYTVRLASGNSETGCKSRTYEMINVGVGSSGLMAGFGYETDTLDLKSGGYPVDFVGVASGSPAKMVWDFGDGDKDSTTTMLTHMYDEPGTYTVCLTVEDPVTGDSNEHCEDVEIVDESVRIDPLFTSEFELNSIPNPFIDYTKIVYTLPHEADIELSIYDAVGKKVKTLISTVKAEGNHELVWDGFSLKPGVYYIRLTTADGMVKTKMIMKK